VRELPEQGSPEAQQGEGSSCQAVRLRPGDAGTQERYQIKRVRELPEQGSPEGQQGEGSSGQAVRLRPGDAGTQERDREEWVRELPPFFPFLPFLPFRLRLHIHTLVLLLLLRQGGYGDERDGRVERGRQKGQWG